MLFRSKPITPTVLERELQELQRARELYDERDRQLAIEEERRFVEQIEKERREQIEKEKQFSQLAKLISQQLQQEGLEKQQADEDARQAVIDTQQDLEDLGIAQPAAAPAPAAAAAPAAAPAPAVKSIVSKKAKGKGFKPLSDYPEAGSLLAKNIEKVRLNRIKQNQEIGRAHV